MVIPSPDRPKTDITELGTRLDCWKEIAAYLGRGERTVKRWESERGLPARRVPGAGRTAVYAYTSELDEWLKSGIFTATKPLPRQPTSNNIDARSKSRNFNLAWKIAFAGTLALCILAAGVYAAALRSSAGATSRWSRAILGKPATEAALQRGYPVSSEDDKARARKLYLKGRYEWNLRTPESLNHALDDFTQAIVHDPNDAEAYVGLADTYALLRQYSIMPDEEAFSRSLAASKKAVELDDSLAEAHRAKAFAEMYGTWDFVDAEREFRRAIELNPKDPVTRRWYANAFAVRGRFDEALREMDIAQSLDPTSHATMADKGWMLFRAGKTEEGIEILKEVERSVPELSSPHAYLMQVGLEQRDYPLFLAEGEKTAEGRNDAALKDIIAASSRGYKRNAGPGLLQELYSSEKQHNSEGNMDAVLFAQTCLLMGRRQEAIEALEEAYDRHNVEVQSWLSDPCMMALNNEPRYKALIKRINFPRASG